METSPPFAPDVAKPAIYSPRVVQTFSALFSGLAGGLLTFYSLRAAGHPAAARKALWFSIGYVALTIVIVNLIPVTNGSLAIALGYGWGYFLTAHFFKSYLPDEASYPRKSWVKPLLIWLAIAALGVWAILSQSHFGE